MSNLIDRQAAIDVLDEIRHALWEIDIPSPTVPEYVEHHEQVQSVWKLLDKKQKELYVLPSVQPERTCVNCGRTVNNGGWYADGRTRCPIEEHYALPKDGYCHLWEKRSVTDDDYPERRTEQMSTGELPELTMDFAVLPDDRGVLLARKVKECGE